MDPYLVDLVDRMLDDSDRHMEPVYNSTTTISWKAYREAEQLDHGEYVPDLLAYINGEKNKNRRCSAYFILSHVAKNACDVSAVQPLIYRIEFETDKYVLSSLLDSIAKLKTPAGTDLAPIFNLMQRKEWLIRHSAIRALVHAKDPLAEDKLIEVLETSTDKYDITYANATLNVIGTPKSIPHLEKHASSRKRDVKLSAKFAIEEIRRRGS